MVKRLWLLRHAKSSWEEPGLADHDRPLAPRGRKASKRIARWVSANGVQPELVLCSTAIRARATLDLISGALGSPVVRFEDGIYHATAEGLLERLRTVPDDVGDVLVVGHNPGLHRSSRVYSRHPAPTRARRERSWSCGPRSRPGRRSSPRAPGSHSSSFPDRCLASGVEPTMRPAPGRRTARPFGITPVGAGVVQASEPQDVANATAALSRTFAPLTQSTQAVLSAGS